MNTSNERITNANYLYNLIGVSTTLAIVGKKELLYQIIVQNSEIAFGKQLFVILKY